METIRNTTLWRKKGNTFRAVPSQKALRNVEIVAFYFGAQWCPPCRRFTPILAACYNTLKQKHEPFEVIFVSEDRNDDEMRRHMRAGHADWLAVNVDREDKLGEKLHNWFGVEGIPALIILRSNGYVITMEGKMDIQARKIDAFYSWLDGSGTTLSPQTVSRPRLDDHNDCRGFCMRCCRFY